MYLSRKIGIVWNRAGAAPAADTAVDDVTTTELVQLCLGPLKTIRGVRLEVMDLDEQEPLRSGFYQETG